MPAIRIVVRGRVQGVGFRYFSRDTADELGVSGDVWNRSDGAVEIIAEHADQAVLDSFAAAVERGPGIVRDVLIEPAAERGFSDFTIGPTR